MFKDIILASRSKKHNNYCIAGIDCETKEWIRIVSEDESIHEAIRPEDIAYACGTIPKILDKIKIKCTYSKPSFHQPENYVLDPSFRWVKLGRATLNETVHHKNREIREHIFYDNHKGVRPTLIQEVLEHERYSLTFVEVINPLIIVENSFGNRKVKMNFQFNGKWYNYLTVTDLDFEREYLELGLGYYKYSGKLLLVISLGELYENYYWKLISTVIRL